MKKSEILAETRLKEFSAQAGIIVDPLKKRENFAVSLRKKKKAELMRIKR
jgi:hypothetical protein